MAPLSPKRVEDIGYAARQILQRKEFFDNLLVDSRKFDFRNPLRRYSAPDSSLGFVLLVVFGPDLPDRSC